MLSDITEKITPFNPDIYCTQKKPSVSSKSTNNTDFSTKEEFSVNLLINYILNNENQLI